MNNRMGSSFEGAGFNYHEEIPVDFAQSHVVEEKITPMNGLNSDPYDFVIESTSDSFLCMNTMYIDGKFNVVKEDGSQRDDEMMM